MRDHTKLRTFELADELALLVYRATTRFPREELYGLTAQMRRAAISIPSNIIECTTRAKNEDIKKRTLSATRRSDQRGKAAPRNGQSEIVENRQIVKSFF